ncbi:MAG: hypothetical protein WAW96_09975 [Alphaproteobacteria bacterium]
MAVPQHPNLKRLTELWTLEVKEFGLASLGRLSARDLQYFYAVFKDSLVARGPKAGPFRLSFIGTDLESHVGRRIINAEIGDCFDLKQAPEIEQALVAAVEKHKPLLLNVWLHRAGERRLRAEFLCLPFYEPEMEKTDPEGHSTTIFGILAIEDLPALPPDPLYRELAIEQVSLISA